MSIKIGDSLPEVTFMEATPAGPEPVKTSDVFAGKTVALFAVPGAFTPTCSAKHLPSFLDAKDTLASKGVDAIVCTSVNDAFVLQAWSKSNGSTEAITMLADGNGAFANAIGLELDLSQLGLGVRSKRYSMLVEDGVVKQLNVEEGGEYKVSGAETLLSQLG